MVLKQILDSRGNFYEFLMETYNTIRVWKNKRLTTNKKNVYDAADKEEVTEKVIKT